ncbi:MAG TPA: CoA-binding protein [Longimicrobiaceae bacterium]
MSDWQANLIEDSAGVREILRDARRIAVLGIKTEAAQGQPAYYVPEYLQRAGYEIVPVPVYYPNATEIMGEKVYRRLADVPGQIDLVNVFRRSEDVLPHVDDILQARPRAVWMQSGIRNAEAARRLAEAGIKVVQDRCAMVEHRYVGR